jgi:hypothetical protein
MDFGLTSLWLLDSYHAQSLLAILGPHLHRAWTNLVIFNPSWFTLKEAFCRISPASIGIMGIRYQLGEWQCNTENKKKITMKIELFTKPWDTKLDSIDAIRILPYALHVVVDAIPKYRSHHHWPSNKIVSLESRFQELSTSLTLRSNKNGSWHHRLDSVPSKGESVDELIELRLSRSSYQGLSTCIVAKSPHRDRGYSVFTRKNRLFSLTDWRSVFSDLGRACIRRCSCDSSKGMDVLVMNLGDFFLCVVGSCFAIAWPGTGGAKSALSYRTVVFSLRSRTWP